MAGTQKLEDNDANLLDTPSQTKMLRGGRNTRDNNVPNDSLVIHPGLFDSSMPQQFGTGGTGTKAPLPLRSSGRSTAQKDQMSVLLDQGGETELIKHLSVTSNSDGNLLLAPLVNSICEMGFDFDGKII